MAIENTGLNLRPIKEESLRMLFCDHHYVAMETPARKRAPRESAALLSIFLISVAQRLQMKSDVSKQILMDLLYALSMRRQFGLCLSDTTGIC